MHVLNLTLCFSNFLFVSDKQKAMLKGCKFQRLRHVCDIPTASLGSVVPSKLVQWPVKIRADRHEHISNHDERKERAVEVGGIENYSFTDE